MAIWWCGAEPSAYAISSRLTDSAWVARLVGMKTARAAKCYELAESARPVYLGDVYIRVAIRHLFMAKKYRGGRNDAVSGRPAPENKDSGVEPVIAKV